jgi:hypothetical protein
MEGEFHFLRDKYPNDLGAARAEAQAIRKKLRAIIEREKFALVVAVAMNMRDFKELDSDPSVRKNPRWESDYMASTYQMVIGLVAEHVRQFELMNKDYKFHM